MNAGNVSSVVLIVLILPLVNGRPFEVRDIRKTGDSDSISQSNKSFTTIRNKINLGQAAQPLLGQVLSAVAPFIGRVVGIVPYFATASNSVTGTINNGIVTGFAIPIKDDYEYYHNNHQHLDHHHHLEHND